MDVSTFIDPAAMAIVGGGTVVATILRTPAADLSRAVSALRVLPRRRFSAEPLLLQIGALARIAQRCGVVALDRTVITDRDLAAGIAAIVDGAPAIEVEILIRDARRTRIERHVVAAEVWAAAAEVAPAMGMIGTLVGLARMFASIDDVSAIGGGMAVALLATLYGAVLANLVLAPVAGRLRAAGRREASERMRIEAPLVALAARETPVHQLRTAA